MAVITTSVYCPECCQVDGCVDFTDDYEYHGDDECPNTANPPCNTGFPDTPPDCENLTIDKVIYSKEFSNNCIVGKKPQADIFVNFDDLGSVTGVTTLSCDQTALGCLSCGFQGTIEPLIESVGQSKFKLKLNLHAQNAYWGGPYGYYISVYWYFIDN